MNKEAFIILIFHILFAAKIELSTAVSTRNCLSERNICNPLYKCRCCPKLYFEDGSNGGYSKNDGYFCNMENAAIREEGKWTDPFPKGCCQKCTSEGEGCTSEASPCCPDQTPEPDASCPDGQTSCKRKDASNTLVDGNNVPKECTGSLPECYGETNFCSGDVWKCCENMYCKPLDPARSSGWGVCTRLENYTGEVTPPFPDAGVGYPQPTAPTADNCWNYGMTTSTTTPAPTTTSAPTTAAPTTAPAPTTTPDLTTPALTTPIAVKPKTSCATEGMYCDKWCCCKGLDCPDNWWPLYITRWVLNWFGIWYRVCRNYSPFAWYNPFTWFDY